MGFPRRILGDFLVPITGSNTTSRRQNKPKPKPKLDQPVPITTTINGEWRLVSSKNTEKFLRKVNWRTFHNIIFLLANQFFHCTDTEMIQTQLIGNQRIFEYQAEFNKNHYQEGRNFITKATRNSLITENTCENPWLMGKRNKILDIEERFMDQDGKLVIVNKVNTRTNRGWDFANCTRIYEKVGGAETSDTIKKEIIGTWKQVARDNFEEFRGKINARPWDHNVEILVTRFFDEIYIQHMRGSDTLKFNRLPLYEEFFAEQTFPHETFFENNSIVTVEKDGSWIVRYVKNGFLFVIFHRDKHYFVCIYEKDLEE